MDNNIILKELNEAVVQLEKYCHAHGCEHLYQHPTVCNCVEGETGLDFPIAWQASIILHNVMIYVKDPEHVGNFMEIARYTMTTLRMTTEFYPDDYATLNILLRQACEIMNKIWAEKGTIVAK